MEPLATIKDLQRLLQQEVDWTESDEGSADFALISASAVVRGYCRNSFPAGAPDDVRFIVARVASRIFKNPQGISYQSYDGMLQQQPVDMAGRLLTPDERLILDQGGHVVPIATAGSIRMC